MLGLVEALFVTSLCAVIYSQAPWYNVHKDLGTFMAVLCVIGVDTIHQACSWLRACFMNHNWLFCMAD